MKQAFRIRTKSAIDQLKLFSIDEIQIDPINTAGVNSFVFLTFKHCQKLPLNWSGEGDTDICTMVMFTCAPSRAFAMIPWLCINHSGHNAYQTKAEYPSYCMVSIKPLLIKNFILFLT